MYAQDNNSLPVWIILSPAHHHISINSQPFLVGIVSEVDEIRPLEEYMECKIDYDPQKGHMKLTLPVFIQSLKDNFQIDSGGHNPQTPAIPGQVLGPVIEGMELTPEEETMY